MTDRHMRAIKFLFPLIAALGYVCPATAAEPAAESAASEIAAGKYLADAAHCDACHTSRSDRPFAGNLPIASKFGTMFSSNITPDPQTGIGQWTEADFTKALREGRGRHGEFLYPSMPYTDFTKISDADVHALWAYFRSVKPIAEKTRPNQMKFPFGIREGIGAWQAVFFKSGRYVPDATEPAQWNRGAYLVEGLGHCGACHTPRNLAMATEKGRALQGGDTGDWWFAPDISGGRYSGIRNWSQEQVVAFLATGHNDKNVSAFGPMLDTVAKGTSKLSKDDLGAIAYYLKHQGEEKPEQQAASQAALSEERRRAGADVYLEHCQTCHGADGKGVPGVAAALAGNSAIVSANPETVVHAVLQGFAPQGQWGAMPSFAQALDNQEIADVVNHVRSTWGGQAAPNATLSLVGRMRDSVDTSNPRIEAALMCPSVPASALDPATTAEIAGLAKKSNGDTALPPGLVRNYRHRHPGIPADEAANDLAGIYCRSLMSGARGSTPEKQMRFIRFMASVATQGAATH